MGRGEGGDGTGQGKQERKWSAERTTEKSAALGHFLKEPLRGTDGPSYFTTISIKVGRWV